MIKITALVTVAIITVCACVSSNAQPTECPMVGQSKLFVGQYHLVFNEKKPICVTSPGVFMIEIKSVGNSGVTVPQGAATVEDKDCEDLSIVGDNSLDSDIIAVVVNGNALVEYECEFLIAVTGLGVLDPKVRVVGDNMMQMLLSEAFSNTLKLTGTSTDQAFEILSELKKSE